MKAYIYNIYYNDKHGSDAYNRECRKYGTWPLRPEPFILELVAGQLTRVSCLLHVWTALGVWRHQTSRKQLFTARMNCIGSVTTSGPVVKQLFTARRTALGVWRFQDLLMIASRYTGGFNRLPGVSLFFISSHISFIYFTTSVQNYRVLEGQSDSETRDSDFPGRTCDVFLDWTE